jgi:hypothetical protein
MASRKRLIQLRQKAQFEQRLKDRLALLAGKGVEPAKADMNPIVRKIKADIRAVNNRLRLLDENDKRTEALAKAKESAAAETKPEKPKKAEQPKEKKEKPKTEKKPAPPKAPEGGQGKSPA